MSHSISSYKAMVPNESARLALSEIISARRGTFFAVRETLTATSAYYDVVPAPPDYDNPRQGYLWDYVSRERFLGIE